MDAGSRHAGAFAAWRSALVRRIAADPVFAPLHEPRHDPLFVPWLDVTTRVGLALPTLVAHGTPYGIDLAALAREALAESDGVDVTWGESHIVTPVHAFGIYGDGLVPPPVPVMPVSGDSDCVRCTGSLPGISDDAYRGSVARYVWDLADRDASAWVVPLGASGDPRDPHHHDQLALWADGRLAPVVTEWALLTEQT